jgi:hypothetical protein
MVADMSRPNPNDVAGASAEKKSLALIPLAGRTKHFVSFANVMTMFVAAVQYPAPSFHAVRSVTLSQVSHIGLLK